MGDSTCLLHGFSYASAIPNQSKQGNSMHQLGESISFGRFMNESLSWDKWSSFPHKKYVEEAERYAQPGSVAEKKAFFEAHYKRIAAQKAAALLLLEQENASKIEDVVKPESEPVDIDDIDDQRPIFDNSHTQFDVLDTEEETVELNADSKDSLVSAVEIIEEGENADIAEERISIAKFDNLENKETTDSVSEGSSGTSQMERPLLKNSDVGEEISSASSKKLPGISSLKSSIRRKTWKIPPTTPAKPATPHFKKENNFIPISTRKSNVESMENKRPSPKSFRRLINLIPNKDPDKEPILASKNPGLKTPMRTPILGAAKKGVSKYPAATPLSENRMKTPIAPTGNGSKTAGPKWHVLSAVCSKSLTACRNKLQSPATLSTPFTLRTEERAAKRKQKLEEKFNADEVQKKAPTHQQKTLKEKAGNEIRKLSYSFCFKARPLPDFYKERETSINHVKKVIPTVKSQTAVLGRSISNKKEVGTVSMPPPPPPPKPLAKNGAHKNIPSKTNSVKASKSLNTPLSERITRENKSPNIQQH
ncbi:hypothetical protein ACP275_11G135100 [Erythranthe tilingii]